MIVANTIATISEALLLAKRGGADPAAVRQAIVGGFADSTILRLHGERILAGNFTPGGPAKHQLKDCRTAIDTAKSVGLDLPVSQLVRQLYEDMVAHGDGEIDHSGLYRELERRNNLI
jgi:2-hydroxy-3-oxopropionate reductase